MADPYTPPLSSFVFTPDESAAVNAALLTPAPWNWLPGGDVGQFLKSAKDKMRDYHLLRHGQTCCYCRTILQGGGAFMIDREHVLPKGHSNYKAYTYSMWNLGAACKRCNIEVKSSDDSFLINKANPGVFQKSSNYSLIHPNFDRWEDHLKRTAKQVNTQVLVKYSRTPGSQKGQFTYDYFELHNLEVDSFDEAQGRPAMNWVSDVALRLRKLAATFGQ
jgi:hypothetical protein